ncbi:MAG: thermonuclease family protein [Nanoarchaeota archaeon]
MKRRHAFIFALAITLIMAVNAFLFSIDLSPSREKVKISRIIDGDTLELEDGRKIRFLNINSPEKNQPGHELAIDYLKNYENKTLEIEVTGMDKYDRTLARIYTPDYLNLELVKKGFASKFLVEDSELEIFADAEKEAIKKSLGIWRKSIYYSCIDSNINEKDEYVIIENNCNKVNISSWILKDESRKIYQFQNIEIGRVILHTSYGKDNETDLFWNFETSVWNNDRDSLYLFDKESNIANYNSYGY